MNDHFPMKRPFLINHDRIPFVPSLGPGHDPFQHDSDNDVTLVLPFQLTALDKCICDEQRYQNHNVIFVDLWAKTLMCTLVTSSLWAPWIVYRLNRPVSFHSIIAPASLTFFSPQHSVHSCQARWFLGSAGVFFRSWAAGWERRFFKKNTIPLKTETHFGYEPMDSEMDSWDLAQLRKSFSHVEPCLRQWELQRTLRERAIKGTTLIALEDPTKLFAPSLGNISLNYMLLKGFTSHMATTGVISTSLVDPVKDAIVAFYELMQCDVKSEAGISITHKVAKNVKKMLFIIRRKRRKWEMPRVP